MARVSALACASPGDRKGGQAAHHRLRMPAQLLLRYGDVQSRKLRQQRAERYLKLHPGKVCAEAEMRSIAEREMRIGVSPEVKVVGVAEDGFVVIGRAPGAQDRISRPDGHVSDLHVGQGDPGVECATED